MSVNKFFVEGGGFNDNTIRGKQWKTLVEEYNYSAIYKDLNLNPRNTIIIDDQPRFLETALQTGANVIQSCITGEFEPQYQFFVKKMEKLPQIINDLLIFYNL